MIETSVVEVDILHFEIYPLPGVRGDQGYSPECMVYTRCISFGFIRRVCRALAFSMVLSKSPKDAFEMGAALNGHSHGYGTRFRRMRLPIGLEKPGAMSGVSAKSWGRCDSVFLAAQKYSIGNRRRCWYFYHPFDVCSLCGMMNDRVVSTTCPTYRTVL